MKARHVVLIAVLMAQTCLAQECEPDLRLQADTPVAYVQAELRALQWLRSALIQASRISPPAPPDDPKRMDKAALRNNDARKLLTYYECALQQIAPYQENKNKYVQASAQAFLNGISTSIEVNRKVLAEFNAVDNVASTEQVDPGAMKRLVDLTHVEENARAMITGAVKMSTFALVKLKQGDTDSQAVAFLITSRQRDSLVRDVEEFRKQGVESAPFIESCTLILLDALNQHLPFPSANPVK